MGFTYHRSITIDHTKVASTQTNFPVLVSVTLADLAVTGSGGAATSSSGFDIVFASDAFGATLLNWEVEKYVSTTGELVAWVKIASLSSSVDTVIYIVYGNSAVTTFQGNVSGTWDSNFKVVYHLGGPSAGTLVLTDSTSNGKTLSNQSPPFKAVSAKIGSGGDFTGSAGATAGAGLYNSSFGNPGFPLTFECWFQIPSTGSYRTFLANNGNANDGIRIGSEPGNKLEYVRGSIAEHIFSSLATLAANTWYYCAVTISGTTVTGYLAAAGGSLASQGLTVTASYNGTPNYIVVNSTTSGSVDGGKYIDEARVSNVARSADWIGTCFKNQDSPSTFFATGAQTPNSTDYSGDMTLALSCTFPPTASLQGGNSLQLDISITCTPSVSNSILASIQLNTQNDTTTAASRGQSGSLQLDAILDALNDAIVGIGSLFSLGSVVDTTQDATLNATGILSLGSIVDASYTNRLDFIAALLLAINATAATASTQNFDGLFALAAQFGETGDGSKGREHSLSLALNLTSEAAGGFIYSEVLSLDNTLEVSPMAVGFLFAEVMAMGLTLDVTQATGPTNFAGVMALAIGNGLALATQAASVGSLTFNVGLTNPQTAKLDAVNSLTLAVSVNLATVGGFLFQEALTLAIQNDVSLAAGLRAVATIALAISAGVDIRPQTDFQDSIGIINQVSTAFRSNAALNAAMSLGIDAGAGPEGSKGGTVIMDAIGMALGIAMAFEKLNSGPGLFTGGETGTPGIFRPEADGDDVPGIFKEPEDDGTPGIFRPPEG